MKIEVQWNSMEYKKSYDTELQLSFVYSFYFTEISLLWKKTSFLKKRNKTNAFFLKCSFERQQTHSFCREIYFHFLFFLNSVTPSNQIFCHFFFKFQLLLFTSKYEDEIKGNNNKHKGNNFVLECYYTQHAYAFSCACFFFACISQIVHLIHTVLFNLHFYMNNQIK